ncbi:MAG: GTP pyrophosphokinase family protein [Lachnospiraceae bacterium]|nr:GTP pyrophosphokinase family protein [Lachnospiraceae bacterium]MDD7024871.1 GTP pyrophosphokinase family protein [Oscillospiraceae bacterium]
MNEKELMKYIPSSTEIAENSELFAGQIMQFQEMMMMYNCAIREVRTKLEVLNDELSIRDTHNPIEMIKSRVKKPVSIVEKLQRRGYPIRVESAMEHLKDVAGIRVICSFIDDIYKVADMLASQDDVKVLEVKDYIKYPKPNGYRSYHMIVEIPVFFSDRTLMLCVEVQIRTIAMDFWASLEHEMKYKKDVEGADVIVKRLAEIAERINQTDMEMQDIRDEIKKK